MGLNMTEEEGMKNYGAELTNARANAGAIVLYQHEEASLIKALDGLNALKSARKAFLMVNPTASASYDYDEGAIANMINKVATCLMNCQSRITNMKESFNQFTSLTWSEEQSQGVGKRWVREEDEANGTVLLTQED